MIDEAPAAQPAAAPAPAPAPAPEAAKPQPAPAPATPETAQGKQGSGTWRDQLKGDLKTHERISQFATPSDMAEAFLEFDGKRDRMIEVPGQDATDDVKAAFRQKLGVPAKADDYKLNLPKLPDGLNWNEAQVADFKQKCHDWGMTNDQAQKALEFDTERTVNGFQARRNQANAVIQQQKALEKQADDALHAEWGLSYHVNRTKAMAALERIIPSEFRPLLQEAKTATGLSLFDDPRTAKLFYELDRKVTGDTGFIRGSGNAPAPGPAGIVDTSKMGLPPGRKNRT